MNGRYDRKEVKQITRQWVKENCKNVTERDLGLLNLLKDRKLLRRDQIESLYPEFPSSDYLNKRLTILFRNHLIDRIYPKVGLGEGSSQQHICLDRAGVILLELDKYNKPIKRDSYGDRALPLGWNHTIAINDYECTLRNSGYNIRLFKTEGSLHYGDNTIIPDILCLVQHDKKGYLFFIEVDLGTEDIPYVKKKLDNYIDYYTSRSWMNESWAKVFKTPTFPRVLFLTEEGRPKRVNSLRQYVEGKSVRFHIGSHSDLIKLMDEIIKK